MVGSDSGPAAGRDSWRRALMISVFAGSCEEHRDKAGSAADGTPKMYTVHGGAT